ncbi:MAG: dienelactone hydrolase family protein [Caldimonas sp.]
MNSVTLTAADGHSLAAYVARPSGTPRGGLVVLQEIFGVNSHIRAVADGYAADGWVAIAPALFDRIEVGIELGYGAADVDRGRALKAACIDEKSLLDIAAAVDHVAATGSVAVVGYCWGGTLAWLAACRMNGLRASVAYYGSGIADLAGLKPMCPVQMHFGEQDASIPPAAIDAVRKAHPEVEVHVYPAGHGFNCDQRSAYHPDSAALARERTLRFLASPPSKRVDG